MEIKGIINIDMTGEEMEAALRRALTLPYGIMLTTYAELVAARDAGELIPGQFYQITDYVTRVKAELSDVRSAGHPFDIIVLATSSTLLLEQAWATQHDGDTYFDGHNLQAWQLRYTLDNDASRQVWADTTDGRGTIVWMRDENGNECNYDFKNIQFLRYAVKGRAAVANRNIITKFLLAIAHTFEDAEGAYANDMATCIHSFVGYMPEREIIGGAGSGSYEPVIPGGAGYTLHSDGTRMFVVIADEERALTIAEVDADNPMWMYTFSSQVARGESATDNSASAYVRNNKIFDLQSVFVGACRDNTVKGSGNTFHNVGETTVAADMSIVADSRNSTITGATCCKFRATNSQLSGTFGFSKISASDSTFFAEIKDSEFAQAVHCNVNAQIEDSSIDKMYYCSIECAEMSNFELVAADTMTYAKFMGKFSDCLFDEMEFTEPSIVTEADDAPHIFVPGAN